MLVLWYRSDLPEEILRSPDLTNMSFDEAINKIAELGLNYAVVQQYSDDVDENDVIRQSPLAGTKLNADDIVTIHVSKGKESSKATEGSGRLQR